MPSIRVVVQNAEDNDVADESKDASYEHVDRFLDDLLSDHAVSGFYEEFDSDDVDKENVEEGTEWLRFLPAKG